MCLLFLLGPACMLVSLPLITASHTTKFKINEVGKRITTTTLVGTLPCYMTKGVEWIGNNNPIYARVVFFLRWAFGSFKHFFGTLCISRGFPQVSGNLWLFVHVYEWGTKNLMGGPEWGLGVVSFSEGLSGWAIHITYLDILKISWGWLKSSGNTLAVSCLEH